jgi:transcriptional regulator with XRE-family HTH domain
MKLDEYLARERLTDAAFAALVNRSQSAISRLRRGETLPDWRTLEAIVSVTDGAVTPNDFLSLPVTPEPDETTPVSLPRCAGEGSAEAAAAADENREDAA